VGEVLVGQHLPEQRLALRRPRPLGDAVEVAVGEHPLGQRGEADAADPLALQDAEQADLDPAVEHRVRGLVDQQRRPQLTQDAGGLLRPLRGVRRDADVAGLALADRGVQRPQALFQRRVGVEPVVVEDVDMVQAQPAQRLVQRVEQVLP
jgi:hypothetical protein